jgi:hypothetical protein
MKKISLDQAVALFQDGKQVNGTTFIGIDTVTVEKLTGGKNNPMQGLVQKTNLSSNVMVFQNKSQSAYGAKVQRHLEKCGKAASDFVLSPRTWGERIEGTPIITHKGTFYLEVIFIKSGAVSYTLEGTPIAKEDIEGIKVSTGGAQGGLEDSEKVIIRTYKFDSIVSFRLNNEAYIIEN